MSEREASWRRIQLAEGAFRTCRSYGHMRGNDGACADCICAAIAAGERAALAASEARPGKALRLALDERDAEHDRAEAAEACRRVAVARLAMYEETGSFEPNALNIAADHLATLTPESVLARAPKIEAIIRNGAAWLLAAEARERAAREARDQEWWDALAGVPGVGSEPADVKRWVMAERELAMAQARGEALEEAAKLAELPCGHYQVGRGELPFWSGDKIAAAIRALAAPAEPPHPEEP